MRQTFAKGIFFDGTLEIKCKRCGEINKIGTLKMADDATHYILIINDQGKITNVSDSACRILGYTCDELIGKYFTQINPTMPKEIGRKFFGPESALNEDNYFRLDTTHQSKDGKKIPITAYFKLYQPTGKEKYLLLSAELKNAASNEKIDGEKSIEFLDYACDFYFDLDKNGIGEYISPSMGKLFGFTQETVISKNYFDYLPDKMRTEAQKTFEYFSAKGAPYRIIHKAGIDANKEAINADLYFTPKFSDFGNFSGYHVLGWMIKNS